MHRRKIFTALILLISTPMAFAAEVSVRAKVDTLFVNLKRSLEKEKNQKEKTKILETFEAEYKAARAVDSDDPDDNIYMDQLALGIKLIPRAESYSEDLCEKGQTDILFALEPTAKEGTMPKQRAVSAALEALKVYGGCNNRRHRE